MQLPKALLAKSFRSWRYLNLYSSRQLQSQTHQRNHSSYLNICTDVVIVPSSLPLNSAESSDLRRSAHVWLRQLFKCDYSASEKKAQIIAVKLSIRASVEQFSMLQTFLVDSTARSQATTNFFFNKLTIFCMTTHNSVRRFALPHANFISCSQPRDSSDSFVVLRSWGDHSRANLFRLLICREKIIQICVELKL